MKYEVHIRICSNLAWNFPETYQSDWTKKACTWPWLFRWKLSTKTRKETHLTCILKQTTCAFKSCNSAHLTRIWHRQWLVETTTTRMSVVMHDCRSHSYTVSTNGSLPLSSTGKVGDYSSCPLAISNSSVSSVFQTCSIDVPTLKISIYIYIQIFCGEFSIF